MKATPGPFSNPEVKLLFADDTAAYGCGKVGRRRVLSFLFPYTYFHNLKAITYLYLILLKEALIRIFHFYLILLTIYKTYFII